MGWTTNQKVMKYVDNWYVDNQLEIRLLWFTWDSSRENNTQHLWIIIFVEFQ